MRLRGNLQALACYPRQSPRPRRWRYLHAGVEFRGSARRWSRPSVQSRVTAGSPSSARTVACGLGGSASPAAPFGTHPFISEKWLQRSEFYEVHFTTGLREVNCIILDDGSETLESVAIAMAMPDTIAWRMEQQNRIYILVLCRSIYHTV